MQHADTKRNDSIVVRNNRRRIWKKIVFTLGCIVVFCTTYALILPAITMEVPVFCGFEEHIHTDECYVQITSEKNITAIPIESNPIIHHHDASCFNELGELICNEADFVVHIHDENCFDDNGVLWCPLPEVAEHIHDEACGVISDDMLSPDFADPYSPSDGQENHIHTDDCYELQKKLVCGFELPETNQEDFGGFEAVPSAADSGLPESAGDIAPAVSDDASAPEDDTSSAGNSADASDISDQSAAQWSIMDVQTENTPPSDSAHVHTEDCYIYENVLICTKEESLEQEPDGFIGELPLNPVVPEFLSNTENAPDAAASAYEDSGFDGGSDCMDILITVDEFGNVIGGQPAEDDPGSAAEPEICTLPQVILHEHNIGCYDEFAALICKMTVVRAHQHSEECRGICYISEESEIDSTVLTCEIPEGEGAHLHSFEGGCYNENMEIICPLEESFGHVHDIHCYGKWEIICGMEAHRHTEECEIDPDSVDVENDIMMLSSSPDSWGYYYDNGDTGNVTGIYWNRTYDLAALSLGEIHAGRPYIICGKNSTTLMSYESFISDGVEYRKAVKLSGITDYSAYQYWQLEEAESGYRIYCMDSSGNKQYLYFANEKSSYQGNFESSILLTADESAATLFTIGTKNGYITISGLFNGKAFYINPYYDDGPMTTHWLGYTGETEIKVCVPSTAVREDTAQRLETVNSSNTILNLFDYWIASDGPEGQYMRDDDGDHPNSGINKNHPYRFTRNGENDNSLNIWVGNGNPPLYGIVENTLGADGYPHLSSTYSAASESLAYLFDPQIYHEGKAVYKRVNGLLRNDDQGYYFFDSKQTMAEYNSDENELFIYDTPGVKYDDTHAGQFFPFNSAPQVIEAWRDDQLLNHYFGMTITTRFLQKNSGYTKPSNGIPTSFHFSGDDDVWIFIDDVLIGDCGGIHDACSVDIDFCTGEVRVYNNAHPENAKTITIREAFEQAGKTGTNWSETQPNTFADETAHTLKFFYLERGNYSSNLELKYNLIEIPKTSIYKVNQYGEVVPGAKFAVYAANESYQILSDLNGMPIYEPSDPKYNASGDLLAPDGTTVLAKSLYTGVTDAFGEMLFVDVVDSVPLTISELEQLFGERFILREIEVPDGYRVVSKDAKLRFWHGSNQTILHCENTTQTGSRAASTLQVTATDNIWINDSGVPRRQNYFEVKTVGDQAHTISQGLMFAVVLKYTGPTDADGNPSDLSGNSSWTPIYGDDKHGYKLVDVQNGDIVGAAIKAAKEMQAASNNVVFRVAPSCDMQVTLENLPGDITSYYRMLDEKDRKQTRYTVGFYWTNQTDLSLATSGNTYAVYSHTDDFNKAHIENAHEFARTFGANIQIPNLINKIFVQKIDPDSNLINGANFALYRVHQDEMTGIINYRIGTNAYAPLPENAVINPDTGVITGTGANGSMIEIHPADVTTTSTLPDNIHVGTGEFVNLDDGQYIVKEIKAPAGYRINTSDIMVLVTDDTIYANAGTEDNGVGVGRGPGYVVNTLDHYASHDRINNTLTWIYARMRISQPSTRFSDIGDTSKISGYITANGTSETSPDPDAALTTYLVYTASNDNVAFNYTPNVDRYGQEEIDTTKLRRIFTTSGWPYYELWRDYDYYKDRVDPNVNYEDWSNEQITSLFSRSTYIRVIDEADSTLTVYKTNTDANAPLPGASFRLYRVNSDGVNEYYRLDNETDKVLWVTDVNSATLVTTGDDGLPAKGFTHVIDGEYYLEEVMPPAGYIPLSSVVKVNINLKEQEADRKASASIPNGDNTGTNSLAVECNFDDVSNTYSFTVTVRNSAGHILPQTGGCGAEIYELAGILVMAMTALLGAVIRKGWHKN